MFWKKTQKTTTAPAEVLLPRPQDILREYLAERGNQTAPSHADKLRLLQSRPETCFSDSEREHLKDLGFRWFVGTPFITKFKCHAQILPPESSLGVSQNFRAVIYAGDIPDAILDRVLPIKRVFDSITVHSMQPLPVKLVKCDPVMVGWTSWPEIHLAEDGSIERVANCEGVVLGIWDKEKEIEVI